MADWVEKSDGNLIARIDNGNVSNTQRLLVTRDGGGAGNDLFQVDEGGAVRLYGGINRSAQVEFERTTGGGNIIEFQTQNVTSASISQDGIGIFTAGGVKLRIISSRADSGMHGDLALYDDTGLGPLHLFIYDSGAGSWQQVDNSP